MHGCDRYARTQMDWRAVRAVLKPIIEAQEGRASMRKIKSETGIHPSTLVRWKEVADKPVDLGKVVTALEFFGESPAAFFAAIERVTSPVIGDDQGSAFHPGGFPDAQTPADPHARLLEVERERDDYLSLFNQMQDAASRLVKIAAAARGAKSRAAARTQRGRSRRDRKIG